MDFNKTSGYRTLNLDFTCKLARTMPMDFNKPLAIAITGWISSREWLSHTLCGFQSKIWLIINY